MKQSIFTLAILGLILTIMAFSSSDKTTSKGALGDVKYSILPPDNFVEENGNGWVLMDDNIPLENSDLKTKHGILELPDARGMFIRGLNLKRNDGKEDKFQKENNRERRAGEYQGDELESHNHRIFQSGNFGTGTKANSEHHMGGDWNYRHIEASGGKETRPKNIAFYVYIKINE